MMRLTASCIVLAAGLAAHMPHSTSWHWQAALVLTEWGHWVALLAAVLLIRRPSSPARAASLAFASVGIGLLLIPLAQAYHVASTLPARLNEAFGAPARVAATSMTARPKPLVATDLLVGMSAGDDVLVDEHIYGAVDGEDLRLDLYRPAFAEGLLPVVVVIHGGAWVGGDKSDFSTFNRYLAARGYVVASIAYRLAPQWVFPAPIEDVARAVQYVKNLELTHGVDPERFALLGRSAGAQIAMLAAYTSSDPAIKGVVSLYGPAALRWAYARAAAPRLIDSRQVLIQYLGGPPRTHGAQYDAAEPAHVVSESGPPTLFIHGMRDQHVSPVHAEIVSARLLELGVPHLLVRLPWAGHGCDYVFSGPCGQLTVFAVEWFLDAVL